MQNLQAAERHGRMPVVPQPYLQEFDVPAWSHLILSSSILNPDVC